MNISGSSFDPTYQYLSLQLLTCTNGSSSVKCRSQQEIDSYFSNVQLQILYVNTNFDMKDFVSPIQLYIDDPLMVQLDTSKQQLVTIQVENATTQLLDDVFAYWRESEQDFFHVEKVVTT